MILSIELDISKNVLTDIPDTIKQCKQLAIFDASVNPLQKIPGEFLHLDHINDYIKSPPQSIPIIGNAYAKNLF